MNLYAVFSGRTGVFAREIEVNGDSFKDKITGRTPFGDWAVIAAETSQKACQIAQISPLGQEAEIFIPHIRPNHSRPFRPRHRAPELAYGGSAR